MKKNNRAAGFAGTTAVVTGASSGIGRAIAIALAAAGAQRVLVHYRRNRSGAEQVAQRICATGATAELVAADLQQPADRERLVTHAFDQLGDVHTWVNNAGADVLTGDAAELSFEAKLQRLLEVDVTGTILLSRSVTHRWQAQPLPQPPCMIFIGWDQAPHGMEGDAGQMFAAAKAAVMGFAASLAQTVAPGVRVNTIAPGWIQTSWGQSTSDYWHHRAQSQALMGRWGTPADVARAVLYAADPDNTFLNGQTIEVNGGWNRQPRGAPPTTNS